MSLSAFDRWLSTEPEDDICPHCGRSADEHSEHEDDDGWVNGLTCPPVEDEEDEDEPPATVAGPHEPEPDPADRTRCYWCGAAVERRRSGGGSAFEHVTIPGGIGNELLAFFEAPAGFVPPAVPLAERPAQLVEQAAEAAARILERRR